MLAEDSPLLLLRLSLGLWNRGGMVAVALDADVPEELLLPLVLLLGPLAADGNAVLVTVAPEGGLIASGTVTAPAAATAGPWSGVWFHFGGKLSLQWPLGIVVVALLVLQLLLLLLLLLLLSPVVASAFTWSLAEENAPSTELALLFVEGSCVEVTW